ncbi:MAG: 1,4-alpha-glucan branching protein GlgB [Clostridiales bacterium]|nr:1,4-alpha-glucan branching protein GlgB [Clostridiales bacterium]
MAEIQFASCCTDFQKGNCTDSYKIFGSRKYEKTISGRKLQGIRFMVWAPAAAGVRVVGDFNAWGESDEKSGKMKRGRNGTWTYFTTDADIGQKYKYIIERKNGEKIYKSDPYALYSECRPGTASVIYELEEYTWTDQIWMEQRARKDIIHSPLNIYEVHLGSWKRGRLPGIDYEMNWEEAEKMKSEEPFLNYRQIADALADYLKEMHYTHVEIMPVSEHPLDGSWGYQTLCFYSITSRYGTPEDFRYFVDRLHRAGIGVILDWVPGHFCKDEPGLYNFDGEWAYESKTEELRENDQWGTANFDFSKGEVRSFLISNALYFFREFHIDGLRVDAVANILYLDYAKKPSAILKNKYGGNESIEGIEFLRALNQAIFAEISNPLMIAEDSSAWPLVTKPVYIGGLGFNFKWNMGWMNDTLEYMKLDPIYRQWHHNKMTFSIMYAFSENYILPLSHDEVVHGKHSMLDKMFGEYDTKFDALRCYYLYMMTHPGKKLLFMGSEFGPFIEWRYYEELEWKLLLYPKHEQLRRYVQRLNAFYIENRALWEMDDSDDGFHWIDANNSSQSIFTYVRYAEKKEDFLVVICNFTPVTYEEFKIGVPRFADYALAFSTEDASNGENEVLLKPEPEPWNHCPFHIKMKLPGYGAMVYRPIFRRKI